MPDNFPLFFGKLRLSLEGNTTFKLKVGGERRKKKKLVRAQKTELEAQNVFFFQRVF